MKYLPECDFIVRCVDLPLPVGGIVMPNDDGTFSIYINARNPSNKQKKSYDHEVRHIVNDDFYNDKDIREIEGL